MQALLNNFEQVICLTLNEVCTDPQVVPSAGKIRTTNRVENFSARNGLGKTLPLCGYIFALFCPPKPVAE